jgi:outer membrane protein assembly factor BamE (lipoprotein component of BamABCDE complex)
MRYDFAMKTLGGWVLSVLLAGCATIGQGRAPGASDFARVHPGMTRDDTLRALGKPQESMRFARSSTEAWDYEHQDAWGYLAVFSVVFGAEGTVVGTTSRRVNDGGDHGK